MPTSAHNEAGSPNTPTGFEPTLSGAVPTAGHLSGLCRMWRSRICPAIIRPLGLLCGIWESRWESSLGLQKIGLIIPQEDKIMIKQMETRWLPNSVVAGLTSVLALVATAAPFQNLDFEQAIVSGSVPQVLPISQALPGWSGFLGANNQTDILYKITAIGSAGIRLGEAPTPFPPGDRFGVSVFSGGSPDGFGPNVSSGLWQRGDVPTDAATLLFDSSAPLPNSSRYRVAIEGVSLSLQPITEGVWGADISGFAGQNAELRFEALFVTGDMFPQSFFGFDNIRFSNVPLVPEPHTWALLGVGLGVVPWCFRSKRSRRSTRG